MNTKVLLMFHLEREATATIIRVYTIHTGAPAFHHKAAVFKQGKLLLLIVNQESKKSAEKLCQLFKSYSSSLGYSILIFSVEMYSFANADLISMMKAGTLEGPKHILITKPRSFSESIN